MARVGVVEGRGHGGGGAGGQWDGQGVRGRNEASCRAERRAANT